MELLVFALVLLAIGGYWVSIRYHPYTQCEACKGTGKHKGAVFNYGFRRCHKCSGVGRKQRLGAQWRIVATHVRRPPRRRDPKRDIGVN